MPFDPGPIDLPVGVFVILRDLVRDRIGVSFEDDKRDLLAAKLTDRVRALGHLSFLDYYYRLKYGPGADEEWPQLTDALSVQETYFWREFDQVRALTDILVPQHVAAGRGPIRVWSAACATRAGWSFSACTRTSRCTWTSSPTSASASSSCRRRTA